MRRNARKFMFWTTIVVGFALLWPQSALAAKKLLRMRLDGPMLESPPRDLDLFGVLRGEEPKTLHDCVKTIQEAAKSSDIAGIVLIIEEPEMKLAQLEELTAAFKGFREKGKKIYCYLDEGNNLTYAVACAADEITLAENSELGIIGLNAQLMYLKGLFDKIGVQADMLHCGAYKSALEPFTRTEPSKEAAENVNWLLDGIFTRWLQLIADGRKLSVDQVKTAVDTAPLQAEQALKLKLVDEVSSFPAFRQKIQKEFGKDVEVLKKLTKKDELKLDFQNPFAIFEFFGKLMEKSSEPAKPGLALIYIDGPIEMGKAEPSLFGGGTSAGSTTIRAAFEKAREDNNIKAVVVRVDSPGGSALASDIMWEAATRCGKEKPLIVSMGGVAGSGGYYVSIPGDVIFAEEGTITGSIGVVGGKLVWKGLMEDKLGITHTEFSRGARAGLMSPNRLWSDQERAWVQGYMDSVYTQFKGRVKQSRGDRIKGDLEQLAGGRVYTGKQALEKGLVDRIGGLTNAIDLAAEKVGLKEYELYVLPKPLDLVEILKKLFGEETKDEWEIAARESGGISLRGPAASDPLLQAVLPLLQQLAPQQAREIAQHLRSVMVLNREHVGCFMPFLSQPR
jgi:protease-4